MRIREEETEFEKIEESKASKAMGSGCRGDSSREGTSLWHRRCTVTLLRPCGIAPSERTWKAIIKVSMNLKSSRNPEGGLENT